MQVLSSMGSWYVFYFMFVVFFGSFYLINLVLAVVAVSYQQEVVAMQERVRVVVKVHLGVVIWGKNTSRFNTTIPEYIACIALRLSKEPD